MRIVAATVLLVFLLACGNIVVEPEPHLWVAEVPADEFPEGAWIVPTDGSGSWPWLVPATLCVGDTEAVRYWIFWWDYIAPNPNDSIPSMGERHEIVPVLLPEADADCIWPEAPAATPSASTTARSPRPGRKSRPSRFGMAVPNRLLALPVPQNRSFRCET